MVRHYDGERVGLTYEEAQEALADGRAAVDHVRGLAHRSGGNPGPSTGVWHPQSRHEWELHLSRGVNQSHDSGGTGNGGSVWWKSGGFADYASVVAGGYSTNDDTDTEIDSDPEPDAAATGLRCGECGRSLPDTSVPGNGRATPDADTVPGLLIGNTVHVWTDDVRQGRTERRNGS